MAGKGFAPKDPSQLRRRNTPQPITHLAADGNIYGPDLPETHEWPAETLAWWQTWRTSAQAQKFTETDWSFLLDTAILHAEFWLGDRSVAAELRLRAAKLGATMEDRARLRIAVGDPAEKPTSAAKPTKAMKSRRARLLRAVGDDS